MEKQYRILGLNVGASRDEIEDAYARLRAKYREDRFLEGFEGNEAARKLTELDQAYADIIEELTRDEAKSEYGNNLGDIDKLIREGSYDSAQSMLDDMGDRGAEWHYLQSIIFYKRNWYLESKKQLQMAVALDSGNDKYVSALRRLEEALAQPINPEQQQRRYNDTEQTQPMGDNACAACCTSLCLADCCCRMMTCCS